MRRVSVVGSSGQGKTTLARGLAARIGVPHLELDALYHQPDWTPLPRPEFRARVAAFVAGDSWVVDGNYSSAVRDLVWARADTVVVLDLPRGLVMAQVLGRTLHRAATGAELWNGNRERWRNLVQRDPQRNILLWAWTQQPTNRARYRAAVADPALAHVDVRVLTSRRARNRFLTGPDPSS